MKAIWVITSLLLGCVLLLAQEGTVEEQYLENFEIENLGESDFSQILSELAENPVNINRASMRELLRIPFLTLDAARNLLQYRKKNGTIKDKKHLLRVPGFNPELVSALLPFIQFQESLRNPKISYVIQAQEIFHRIRGYIENRYGNSLKFYHKIIYAPSPHWQTRLIWEKDAGETQWFDFGSLVVQYHSRKKPYAISAGDFNLKFGQQLVFGRTYGIPITVNSPRLFRSEALDVFPKSSINEFSFLRGVYGELNLSAIQVSMGYSSRQLDANIEKSSGYISSFYTSGLHRTPTEENKRNQERENIGFLTLRKSFLNLETGLLLSRAQYERPIRIDHRIVTSSRYISYFYNFHKEALSIQGELGVMNEKIPATQHSFYIGTPFFFVGAALYYYHPDYWALHGKGLGEINNYPTNKIGFLFNVGGKFSLHWQWSVLWHIRRKIRDENSFPNWQRKLQMQIKYYTSQRSFRIFYNQELLPTGLIGLTYLKNRIHRLRLDLSTFPVQRLRLSHRLEASYRRPTIPGLKKYGFSFYLDFRYQLNRKATLQVRWTHFDIPDFDLRLYEFENDLPGNFQNVLLNGRGYKWFVLIQLKQWNWIQLYLKYQQIYYPDLDQIGSGLDTILGNRKRTLRLQARFRI